MAPLAGRQGRQVALSLVLKGVAAGGGFALSWVMARLYGANGLGVYAIGVTTVVLLSYLALLGQDYVLLRTTAAELKVGRPDIARGTVRTATGTALLLALAAAALLAAGHDRLARALDEGRSAAMLLAIAPSVVALVLMRTGSWAARGAGSIVGSQAIEGPITTGTALVTLCVLALAGLTPPLWGTGLLHGASTALGAAVGWTIYRRLSARWPAPAVVARGALVLAGLPMMISTVSNYATEWLATFSVGSMIGTAAAGQLRVSLQIMSVITLVVSAFDGVLGPQIAAAWRAGEVERIRRIYRLSTWGMTALAMPVIVAALALPERILGLFGPGFVGGADMLRVLAVGQLFALAGGPIGTVLVMSGQTRYLTAYAVGSLAVLAALALVAVPLVGATGGAVVVAGVMIFRRVAAGLIVRHVMGLRLALWSR